MTPVEARYSVGGEGEGYVRARDDEMVVLNTPVGKVHAKVLPPETALPFRLFQPTLNERLLTKFPGEEEMSQGFDSLLWLKSYLEGQRQPSLTRSRKFHTDQGLVEIEVTAINSLSPKDR